MKYNELLHKTAEMIAADEWNKRNTQDLFHNQSTEMQAVLRANKMDIASLMVGEFYKWFKEGYLTASLTSVVMKDAACVLGLAPDLKQDSPIEENWKL